MTDLREQLQSAVGNTYTLQRELGGGGMSRVFLATELALDRPVVLKLLPPDLSSTLSTDRFRQEIRLAARLQHPHIVPLLSAGEADGLLYFTMPYIEGESLRARVSGSGELPVREALRILRDVVAALAYAHERGVVHRDIKPDNVLISGGEALVTDFGVAKAVSDSATGGGSGLTSIGVALGTPAYMSPEQAAADPHVDHRADLYAVGCLAYEILTGQPPFTGRSPSALLAAHATETAEPIERRRPNIPAPLSGLIMRCLEKRPADRPQTATELLQQLETMSTPSGGMTPTQAQPARAATSKRRSWTWISAVAVVLLVGSGLVFWRPHSSKTVLDPNLVAVMPFRVAGADPSVQYLRQGMVDLLQAKLTGEGGPRAADTRSVLAAVRDAGGTDAIDLAGEAVPAVARKLGAGRVLQGSIVGPADHVVISATILEMPGGRTIAQTSVEGPKDSIFTMVDRLTAQLLALGAGASATQLSAVTTTSLDALRAYLDGVVAYRRGAFQKATPLLERAVQLDSTFALALSGLIEANGWHSTTMDFGRVRHLAWQYRDRLNPRDQLLLSIRLGSRYPRYTPWTDRIADRERATQLMPESAEAWYYLGDGLFHYGHTADIADADARAQEAFEHAFQLDSLYGGPIAHRARLAFVSGDTVALRLWTRRMLALDSTAEGVPQARWDLAVATRDEGGIRAFLARAESVAPFLVGSTPILNPLDSATISHEADLFAVARRHATSKDDRLTIMYAQIATLWDHGRQAEARRLVDTLRGWNPSDINVPFPTFDPQWMAATGAVWFGGAWPDTSGKTGEQIDLLRLAQGDYAAGDRLLAKARTEARSDTLFGGSARQAALLDAWIGVGRKASTADRLLDVADSLWRGVVTDNEIASIQLSRLFEARGRTDRALTALRRRMRFLGQPDPWGLAEALRLEGKLAAQTGDRVAAIRAYRNYLILRADPDPALVPQRDSVRTELAAVGDLEGKR